MPNLARHDCPDLLPIDLIHNLGVLVAAIDRHLALNAESVNRDRIIERSDWKETDRDKLKRCLGRVL